jgi:uncharacterized protein YraI
MAVPYSEVRLGAQAANGGRVIVSPRSGCQMETGREGAVGVRCVVRNRVVRALCLAGLLGVASEALAAPGVVPGGVTMFAGPSPAYPVVVSLPPGTPVEVFGCQSGWGWCDVANGPYRGWAAGNQVELLYNDAPAPLETYGPVIGLPLLGFAFGSYWGAHYRHEPWYAANDRWGGRPGGPGMGPRGFGPQGGGFGRGPVMGGGPREPMRAGPGWQGQAGRGPGGGPGRAPERPGGGFGPGGGGHGGPGGHPGGHPGGQHGGGHEDGHPGH